MHKPFIGSLALTLLLAPAAMVQAQIKIGVTVSATGPAASLGIPEKNTVAMCPKNIAGKSVSYIGLNDALGEAFFAEVDKAAAARKIPLAANERFAPKDTSVTGQALKLIAAKPDAIVIGASGTPAALPARTLIEQGYKGKLYFNHGVANNDFLRVGGKDVDGAYVPASPVIVASQLPDNHPAKKHAQEYVKLYETAQGAGSVSAFGSYTWDACLEIGNAIPQALKSAQPGTREFRRALRDALEATKGLEVTNGVVNMSKTDHLGLDARARVMVQIQNGKWVLQK